MKISFCFLIFYCFFLTNVSAQLSVGSSLAYGIEGKDFGIQAKTSFTINKNWCILVDYIYYFDKQAPVSFWEMNGIAQFIFLKKEKWDYYVLGGLGFFKENVDFFGIKETRTDLQLNLGTGVNYLLTDKLKATIEGRFSLGGAFLVFTTGLSYQF